MRVYAPSGEVTVRRAQFNRSPNWVAKASESRRRPARPPLDETAMIAPAATAAITPTDTSPARTRAPAKNLVSMARIRPGATTIVIWTSPIPGPSSGASAFATAAQYPPTPVRDQLAHASAAYAQVTSLRGPAGTVPFSGYASAAGSTAASDRAAPGVTQPRPKSGWLSGSGGIMSPNCALERRSRRSAMTRPTPTPRCWRPSPRP